MSDLGLALRQVRYENRAFWRNPPAAFFTFAFPLIFLVLFNLLFGDEDLQVAGREVSASQFYVPAIAAFSIVTATFTNLAIGVSFSREQGLLKRLRGTPLPGWGYLFGRVAHAVLVTILLVAWSPRPARSSTASTCRRARSARCWPRWSSGPSPSAPSAWR